MYLVVPIKNGKLLIPDHAIAYVDLRKRALVSDVRNPTGPEYGELVIRLNTGTEAIVVRHTWENANQAFQEIVNHWEQPAYLVELWFADTDPKRLFESPAPEAVATGD